MLRLNRLAVLAVLAATALLAVGATAASAHGGRGPGGGAKIAAVGTLVTEAAKQLGITRAALVAAIEKSAVARIDEAVEDEELDEEEAEELKEEAQDNLRVAYALSRARTVASALGVTTAKLNAEFRDARRAIAEAKTAAALEEGDIDAEEAAERREELADADLPGYKAGGLLGGRGGFGGGPGGHRR